MNNEIDSTKNYFTSTKHATLINIWRNPTTRRTSIKPKTWDARQGSSSI